MHHLMLMPVRGMETQLLFGFVSVVCGSYSVKKGGEIRPSPVEVWNLRIYSGDNRAQCGNGNDRLRRGYSCVSAGGTVPGLHHACQRLTLGVLGLGIHGTVRYNGVHIRSRPTSARSQRIGGVFLTVAGRVHGDFLCFVKKRQLTYLRSNPLSCHEEGRWQQVGIYYWQPQFDVRIEAEP
ncbi:hypothetical protein V8F20_007202, partial [Naviculisporaceae sp. PSN 640]